MHFKSHSFTYLYGISQNVCRRFQRTIPLLLPLRWRHSECSVCDVKFPSHAMIFNHGCLTIRVLLREADIDTILDFASESALMTGLSDTNLPAAAQVHGSGSVSHAILLWSTNTL